MCLLTVLIDLLDENNAAVPKECGRESRLSELGWNACRKQKDRES